ncbi:hypothetical protein CAEBREN_04626 [Caenorhabditis brenneri]|uniref:Uncharacterized protein n=1 Tax=Caenorhabditis brenneri TaxID=135651 RepID=G0MHM5_CAEBE|nr:hypothetical protein CAEBREN_04626 [Caenorhabditis brenneri]
MSIIIGRPRSVSLSCLVRSSIKMPEELEDKIKLDHEVMGNWQHISGIQNACEKRVKQIQTDYLRANSYESMRIINTRMTDVLIAITPVKDFMEFAIKRCEELEKEKKEKEKTGDQILNVATLETQASQSESIQTMIEVIPQLKNEEEDVEPPEENNLLLNENHEKPNEYEEQPRRRSTLFGCFGL